MSKTNHKNNNEDDRPVYVSPSVIRLDNVHRGMGVCAAPGSGETGNCSTGSRPSGNCGTPGSTADQGNCSYHGIQAAGACANPGSGGGK